MRASLFPALALLAATVPLSAAQGAPQILGLIASNGAVPLTCAKDACTAELSSFCLQRERPVPPAGTAYSPVGAVTLVLTGADGTRRTLAAAEPLRFESERNYTAVVVSLPAETYNMMGD